MKPRIPHAGHTDPTLRRAHRMAVAKADLLRVARLCGRKDGDAPTVAQYQAHGTYGVVMVQKVSGASEKWSRAMERYGLRISNARTPLSEMLADVRRVAHELGSPGRMPTEREYAKRGRWVPAAIKRRLRERGWFGVAMAAGLRFQDQRIRRWTPPARDVERYQALAEAMGYRPGGPGPSSGEWWAATGIDPTCIKYRFGTWNTFVARAGFQPRRSGGRHVTRRRVEHKERAA